MRFLRTMVALSAMLAASTTLAQELTVWDWKSGDPVTASYYDKAKADFEAAHPGVTINYVMQPHDQYYTLLGTALSSSAGPDVILLHGGAQAKERTGALVKLDEKVADVKSTIVGWEEFTGPDGGVYAVPLSIQGFVVYYNKARYTEAGLDAEKAPRAGTSSRRSARRSRPRARCRALRWATRKASGPNSSSLRSPPIR